jgi:hypothetical protein
MTDQAPTPTPMPTMTPQQAQIIRQAVFNSFNTAYGEFINKINQFPSHQPAKMEAFKFFDTGYLWFEKAIQNMPIATSDSNPQSQAPAEPAQAQQETKTSEENKVEATLDNVA